MSRDLSLNDTISFFQSASRSCYLDNFSVIGNLSRAWTFPYTLYAINNHLLPLSSIQLNLLYLSFVLNICCVSLLFPKRVTPHVWPFTPVCVAKDTPAQLCMTYKLSAPATHGIFCWGNSITFLTSPSLLDYS